MSLFIQCCDSCILLKIYLAIVNWRSPSVRLILDQPLVWIESGNQLSKYIIFYIYNLQQSLYINTYKKSYLILPFLRDVCTREPAMCSLLPCIYICIWMYKLRYLIYRNSLSILGIQRWTFYITHIFWMRRFLGFEIWYCRLLLIIPLFVNGNMCFILLGAIWQVRF